MAGNKRFFSKLELFLIILASVLIFVSCARAKNTTLKSEETAVAKNEKYCYPPRLYVNDRFYEDTDEVVDCLPDDIIYLGELSKKLPSTEVMPRENFTSNVWPEGAELFGDPNSATYVYVKYTSSNGDTMYSIFQELDYTYHPND